MATPSPYDIRSTTSEYILYFTLSLLRFQRTLWFKRYASVQIFTITAWIKPYTWL